jgi:hypothetical protein
MVKNKERCAFKFAQSRSLELRESHQGSTTKLLVSGNPDDVQQFCHLYCDQFDEVGYKTHIFTGASKKQATIIRWSEMYYSSDSE